MTFQTAICDELGNNEGVAALVVDRIFPVVADRENQTLPYIVYQIISHIHEHHMTAAAGLATARVQFTCLASTQEGAVALGETVREALDGFRNTMGSGDNTASVQMCHLENEIEGYEDIDDADEDETYTMIQDYMIAHTVSVPTFS